MGELMRRRALMQAANDGPTEIYWDYTMGMPDANGWTKQTGGTGASVAIDDTGLKCTVARKSPTGYVNYVYSRYDPVSSFEVSYKLYQNNTFVTIMLSADGEHGCEILAQYSTNYSGIRINDAADWINATKLKAIKSGTPCKIKIAIDNGYVDVWLDDVQYVTHRDISELQPCQTTRFRYSEVGSNSARSGYFFSTKLKLGST